MTIKDITIVIATYKSEEKIENCINSINPNIKIIIVENSNNKKFQADIQNKFSNVKCILANDNLGYGKANNIGLKNVETKYSLILNPDTILKKNTINNFLAFLEKNINFALLGPLQEKKLSVLDIQKQNNINLFEVEYIKGFAMFLNMKKFKNIGFFDENLFLFLEEIDLCRRVKKINEKIFVDENIKIFHYGGKSVGFISSQEIELTRNWHWMWSTFYFNKKYNGFFIAFLKIVPTMIKSFFKFIFYSVTFNQKKRNIYLYRLSGINNSLLGKKSWYRPII